MSSSSSSSSSSSTSTSTSSSQSRSQAAPAPEPTVTSRRRRNGKEKANGNGEGSSKHILKPVPFMSVLTEDQTDYFDLDDNLFESMNMGANGIRLGANEADEDAEEIEAAGDDTTSLTYLQASRANTTTRTLARRTRKLPEPFTGQDTEEGHQVILEMKMHRLEGESPELFNIRVQMAEKKAGLRAKKLAAIKKKTQAERNSQRQKRRTLRGSLASCALFSTPSRRAILNLLKALLPHTCDTRIIGGNGVREKAIAGQTSIRSEAKK
ncbi:hypothetical protein BKA57DRAFT_141183 [Linnemannia elongata]|nr:hypothetical protein BKA57DRAFT_141183 [Linnemannia elongata]